MISEMEQRRYRRLRCSGTAEVYLAADEAPHAARVVNLSSTGCLLILRAPQLLARGTRVELAFTVNHLPFRVFGEVKAVRSDQEFGLYFPALSRRAQVRLEDLIEELGETQRNRRVEARPGMAVA